jgi:hypothetical protein
VSTHPIERPTRGFRCTRGRQTAARSRSRAQRVATRSCDFPTGPSWTWAARQRPRGAPRPKQSLRMCCRRRRPQQRYPGSVAYARSTAARSRTRRRAAAARGHLQRPTPPGHTVSTQGLAPCQARQQCPENTSAHFGLRTRGSYCTEGPRQWRCTRRRRRVMQG